MPHRCPFDQVSRYKIVLNDKISDEILKIIPKVGFYLNVSFMILCEFYENNKRIGKFQMNFSSCMQVLTT